jgi:regulatory protein
MIITKLEEIDKSKVKVYIDEEYAFWMNQKEVEQLGLADGTELSDILYRTIYDEIILKRAKEKALSILKFTDRTELEVRKKLSEAGYQEDIIEKAIAYVSSYGYLNDERLASSFTRARMNKKSKMVIRMELMQKGVSIDVINQVLSEEYSEDPEEDAELEAIRKAVAKKTKSPETMEREDKQKLIASLYRKGFNIGKIKKILE